MGNLSICRYPFAEVFPFAPHEIDVNGFWCHYIDEGDGPAVLMLHGNPTWSFFYRSLVRELSPSFRTVVPDHIGCGLSERPATGTYPFTLESRIEDMERFVESVGMKRPMTVIAHDWGGAIGAALAIRHPDWIQSMILMNTAAFSPPKQKTLPFRIRVIRSNPRLAKLLILQLNLFVLSALFLGPAKHLSCAAMNGLLAPYRKRRNREAVYRFVMDIPIASPDPSWKTLDWLDAHLTELSDIPILLAWGLRDAVFDRDYFLEWKRRLPGAETAVFPDAGHYLLEDEPHHVGRIVSNFLKRTAA